MSGFSSGQRVLCVDGKFHPSVWEYVNEVPLEGETYTVRFVQKGHENVTGKFGPALALEEISGRLPGSESEVCWMAWRFAPLDFDRSASAAAKKKTAAKRKNTHLPRRKRPEPAVA